MSNARRTFLIQSLAMGASLACARHAGADAVHLSPSDPSAQALGYTEDATKVDKAKYARYQAGQSCSNCQFFKGKPGDAFGTCPMFGTKEVAATGWCSAYSKRT